jgi:hypothetical protein
MRCAMMVGAFLLAAGPVRAETAFLTTGRTLDGKVTLENGKVVVQVPHGRIVLEKDQVVRIEPGPTALDTFAERFAAIDVKAPDAAERLVELARWCKAQEMPDRERECLTRALAADPDYLPARAALGYTRYNGVWMTQEEFYRAQGLVFFRKAWVTPEVRDQVLQAEAQREAEDARAKAEDAKLAEAQAQTEPRPAFYPRAYVQYYRNVGRDRPAYVHRYYRPYLYTTGGNVLEIWPGAAMTGP